MKKSFAKKKPEHIAQEDWDAVDSPVITDFSGFQPSHEVVPEIVAAHRAGNLQLPLRHRGPQKAPLKQDVHMRLSPLVSKTLRGQGRGWQTRLDRMLLHLIQTNRLERLEKEAEKALAV